MPDFTKKYKSPQGIIEASFIDLRGLLPCQGKLHYNVQFGLEESKIRKVVPEEKFLELKEKYKWKEMDESA